MPQDLPGLLDTAWIGPAGPWIEFAQSVLICARRVRARLAAEAVQHGLNRPEIEMLWACAQAPSGGRSQCALASDLATSPAHVSGVVERLRRSGLLQCTAVEGDRRLRMWKLTPAGEAVWEAFVHALTERSDTA